MAKTSDTVTVTDAEPKVAPVGFSQTNAKRLADDTRSIVTMLRAANEEKGDKRTRAVERVKILAACIVCDIERDHTLAATARGTRIGVEVESKLRGEKSTANQSIPVFDVIRALAFGGFVQGGGRLV